jgi:hypothetical protein
MSQREGAATYDDAIGGPSTGEPKPGSIGERAEVTDRHNAKSYLNPKALFKIISTT